PQHLVHRHDGRAEHDGDIERDIVDGGHENLGRMFRLTSPRDGYGPVNGRCGTPVGLHAVGEIRAPEWTVADGLVPYGQALAVMDERVAAIAAGDAPELIWLLEHPPLYTAGTSAGPGDLLDPQFPVFSAGRGGQFTYHGPGQRVAYVMLDLKRRNPDIR